MLMPFTDKDARPLSVQGAQPESPSECRSQATIPARRPQALGAQEGAWPARRGRHQPGHVVIRPASSPYRR